MMKLLFFLILTSSSAFAASVLKDKVHDLLPSPLKEFTTHKTPLSEVEKKLGKAHLIEGNDYFWEKDGLKYALKLSFDNKFVLDSIHYTFVTNKPKLETLGTLDTKKLEPYTSGGKSSKYLILRENKSEVVIDPLEKSIYSVKVP